MMKNFLFLVALLLTACTQQAAQEPAQTTEPAEENAAQESPTPQESQAPIQTPEPTETPEPPQETAETQAPPQQSTTPEPTPKEPKPETYDTEEAALQDPSLPLDRINLPEGFTISVFATNIPHARSMARSPGGTLFVGTRKSDKVYALKDRDNDGKADQKFIVAENLRSPNGVALEERYSLSICDYSNITGTSTAPSYCGRPAAL